LTPTLERLRAQFGTSIDPKQVKQLGILDTLLGQLIERSLLDQETQASASKSPTRRCAARSIIIRRSGGPTEVRPPALRPGADAEPDSEDQLVAGCGTTSPRSDLVQAITTGSAVPRPVVDALHRYATKSAWPTSSLPVAAVRQYRPAERG